MSDTAVALSDAAVDDILLTSDAGNGVMRLTLNRPAAYNSLSRALMARVQTAIDEIAGQAAVRVVVINGAGRGFCAGHDLNEVRSLPSKAARRELMSQCSRLMTSLVRCPKPVIAEVHGVATAAGCQLVASCDLAYAAEDARFGTPGVNIGLFCHTPMVALSRNVARKHAMEMLLTGELIDAETATEIGLINGHLPGAELSESVLATARKIASKSSYTLKIGKEAFYRQLEMNLDDAYTYASEVMVENMLARDADEGIAAFIEKRPPIWQDS